MVRRNMMIGSYRLAMTERTSSTPSTSDSTTGALPLLVEHVDRHPVAAQLRQRGRDGRVAPGPVGAQQGDLLGRQVGKHIVMRQRRLLVVLAGHAPGGGEIHEHRLARREQLIHAARLPGCQGPASTRAVCCGGIRVITRPGGPAQQGRATASEIAETTVRARPRSVKAQTSMLIATSSTSSAPAPSMPLCWPSTHTSQATVANIGKAMSLRKVSIHAPGRGSSRATAGTQLAAR